MVNPGFTPFYFRWVFECAWEVANKVGGIYTVIRSKTGVSVNEMGDQYVCLGPYLESKARAEIEEEDFPPHHPLGQAIENIRQKGYKVHCGRWLVDGNPQVGKYFKQKILGKVSR